MKILHTVEFYSPSVGGAQEVVRQVSERLVRRGHEVTVATTRLPQRENTTINGVRVQGFAISGNQTLGYRGETDPYLKFLANGNFDLMMNYAAQQWATDLAFSILDDLPYSKVLAPCGFSSLFDAKYTAYFREMSAVMGRYDHLILHSEMTRDAQFVRQHGLLHHCVIPNGAAHDEFSLQLDHFRHHYSIPNEVPMLLTVGSHTGWKGHSLVMEAFRRARIGPAVLVVIGNVLGGIGCLRRCRMQAAMARLLSQGKKQILLLDPPRKDVVAAYHAADLFVFGSNIECSPIVLFEAIAARTPFVSTDVGNAKEIAQWTGGGVVIPTTYTREGIAKAKVADMSHAIEELLSSRSKLEALATAGHQAWKDRFSWEAITTQYETLYTQLVQNASQGVAPG
jgi:glycosyltransferase involved in cell wall biosynthesis